MAVVGRPRRSSRPRSRCPFVVGVGNPMWVGLRVGVCPRFPLLRVGGRARACVRVCVCVRFPCVLPVLPVINGLERFQFPHSYLIITDHPRSCESALLLSAHFLT